MGQEIKLLLFFQGFAIIMKQKAKHLLNMVSVFFHEICSIPQNAVASSPAVKNKWN